MRGALVFHGGPKYPSRAKIATSKLERLFYEATDPNLTATYFNELRAIPSGSDAGGPMTLGVMRDPKWDNYPLPDALAGLMHNDLLRVGAKYQSTQATALADIEVHDAGYVLAFFKAFRKLRPTRELWWAPESFQGGWMKPELVEFVNADPLLFVVRQLYLGEPRMYEVDGGESLVDLIRPEVGLAVEKCRLAFYDAERPLPYGWNGVAYNFEALP